MHTYDVSISQQSLVLGVCPGLHTYISLSLSLWNLQIAKTGLFRGLINQPSFKLLRNTLLDWHLLITYFQWLVLTHYQLTCWKQLVLNTHILHHLWTYMTIEAILCANGCGPWSFLVWSGWSGWRPLSWGKQEVEEAHLLSPSPSNLFSTSNSDVSISQQSPVLGLHPGLHSAECFQGRGGHFFRTGQVTYSVAWWCFSLW